MGALELALYAIAACTPLLWFHGSAIISGGDIDYPFDPVARLLHRSFTWDRLFFGGTDLSLNVSTLAFTAIEALPYLFTHDLAVTERFAFVVWFLGLGLAMAYLVRGLYPYSRVSRIIASFFYMFNFYQFSNWESFRIGELSAAVLLPLALGAMVRALRGSISLPTYGLILAAAFVGCMGIGVQPPALLVIGATVALFAITELIAEADRVRTQMRFVLSFLVVTSLVPLFASASWLIPELNFIALSGYTNSAVATSVYDVGNYVDFMSRFSSIGHNLALMGQFSGYDTWNGLPYLPLLYGHFTNPIFAALGLLIPIAAFTALMYDRSRTVLFFSAAALITIFFSKGVHGPWGDAFTWFSQHVPGFWVFRAPWEKFALVTAVAYAVLIGRTSELVLQGRPLLVRRGVVALVVVGIIAYHYPLVLGGMFPRTGDRGLLLGYYQRVPDYVQGMAQRINAQNGDFSVAIYPIDRSPAYTWGYWAPSDITMRLLDKSVVAPQYGEGVAPPHPFFALSNRLAESLYSGNSGAFGFYASLLDVQSVLQRNDTLAILSSRRIDVPGWMTRRYAAMSGVYLAARSGKWDLYDVGPMAGRDRVSLADRIVVAAPLNPDPVARGAYVEGLDPLAASLGIIPTRLAIVRAADWSRDTGLRAMPALIDAPAVNARTHFGAVAVATADAQMTARVYETSKAVVLPAGADDPDAIVNDRHFHFRFPIGPDSEWNVAASTLLYIQTGAVPLTVHGISEGHALVGDVNGIVWADGWYGFQTRPFAFPVTIPANRRAIVQINHEVATQYLNVVTEARTYRVPIQHQSDALQLAGFRTFRSATEDDAFTIDAYATGTFDVDILFGGNASGRGSLLVDGIQRATFAANGFVRVPGVVLARGLHHAHFILAPGTSILAVSALAGNMAELHGHPGSMIRRYIDPTHEDFTVDATAPTVLVFSENFHPQWTLLKGSPGPLCLLFRCNAVSGPILVNGFANGWRIPAGRHEYTMIFWPQILFYIGTAVELTALLALGLWWITRRRSGGLYLEERLSNE